MIAYRLLTIVVVLTSLLVTVRTDTTPAGAELFIGNGLVNTILNKNLASLALGSSPLTDIKDLAISNGYQWGTVSLTGLVMTLDKQASTQWNVVFSTNQQYLATLSNIGHLEGKYTITFPDFIENGSFIAGFPQNSIQFQVTLTITQTPLAYSLSYSTFTYTASKSELASVGYYFNKLNLSFNNQLLTLIHDQVLAYLPTAFSTAVVKPSAYINNLLNQKLTLATDYIIDYSVVPSSTPDIDPLPTSGYLGFRSNGTVYLTAKPVEPEAKFTKPSIYPLPTSYTGDFITFFSKYFINSVFVQVRNNLTAIAKTVNKALGSPDQQALFNSKNYNDLITDFSKTYPDNEVQVIVTVADFDKDLSFIAGTPSKFKKNFQVKYQLQALSATFKDAVTATATIAAQFIIGTNKDFAATCSIESLTVSGSVIDTTSPLKVPDAAKLEAQIQLLVNIGMGDINAKAMPQFIFTAPKFTDSSVVNSLLTVDNTTEVANLTYYLN